MTISRLILLWNAIVSYACMNNYIPRSHEQVAILYNIGEVVIGTSSSELYRNISWPLLSNISLEEINSAFQIRPTMDWIGPVVKQQSIRILCLGGSNTQNDFRYL